MEELATQINGEIAERLRWIPVTERLPEEHDSIFAKLKGTGGRKAGMFGGVSDYVLVTIEHEGSALKMCQTAKTIDGKWENSFLRAFSSAKVVAWMPFPKPYKKDEDDRVQNRFLQSRKR